MSSSSLRAEKKAKEEQLKKYWNRLKEVCSVKRNLDAIAASYASDIHTKVANIGSNLASGIKNCSNIAVQCEAVNRLDESYDDAKVQEASTALVQEINDIDTKISELQDEIRDLERRIEEAVRREREEAARRAREAAERRAREAARRRES